MIHGKENALCHDRQDEKWSYSTIGRRGEDERWTGREEEREMMDKHRNDEPGPVVDPGSIRQLRVDREWTTMNGKPTLFAHHLSGIDGVYVQCRLPNGEDVFISLREIYALFEKELLSKFPTQGGQVEISDAMRTPPDSIKNMAQ